MERRGDPVPGRASTTSTVGFAGQPGFPDPAQPAEARVVSATCAGMRVWSVYVPNGRTPDDPHFVYKLAWLKALAGGAAGRRRATRSSAAT